MQTCVRWSFDSRRSASGGTIVVPCFVFATIGGSLDDVAASCSDSGYIASTGAQSIPEQHSIGYHSCARAWLVSVRPKAKLNRLSRILRANDVMHSLPFLEVISRAELPSVRRRNDNVRQCFAAGQPCAAIRFEHVISSSRYFPFDRGFRTAPLSIRNSTSKSIRGG